MLVSLFAPITLIGNIPLKIAVPDPEILIRTGGTQRMSNILLWQLAYAEIFFLNKMWPDFTEGDFNKITSKFHRIKRYFGKI